MRYHFIELPPFRRGREECFAGDEDFRDFQLMLMEAPDRWPVIRGAAPLRKARWRSEGRGKGRRGGCRVIYFHVPETGSLVLVHCYSKSEQDDLQQHEKEILGRIAREIRRELIAKRGGEP